MTRAGGSDRTVVVTGSGGQVGRELCRVFAGRGWDVVATDHTSLDITARDHVRAFVHTVRPALVINAAAHTDVDGCETDPDTAFAVNALGVRHLAEACRDTGSHLAHISTDYVFDGTKPGAYHEWDAPNPRSVYGQSKLAGEIEARTAGIGATIVRTSWVCGVVGSNMVRTVMRLADSLADDPSRTLAFVDDQRGCPTIASDLAEVVARLAVDRRPGLFHVTNQGATTWYGFVREILSVLGHDPDRVRPISTGELDPPRPAPRPANSVLDNAALRLSGIAPAPPWSRSLPGLVAAIRGQ